MTRYMIHIRKPVTSALSLPAYDFCPYPFPEVPIISVLVVFISEEVRRVSEQKTTG